MMVSRSRGRMASHSRARALFPDCPQVVRNWTTSYASTIHIFVMAAYSHTQSFASGTLTWIFLLPTIRASCFQPAPGSR